MYVHLDVVSNSLLDVSKRGSPTRRFDPHVRAIVANVSD